MTANQLLIIDALNLIRRFDAISQKQHQQPEARFQATLSSTLSAIEKLIKRFIPSHIVAVFDQAGPDWRNTLYSDYKANRQPMPTYLADGLATIQDSLLTQGIDSLLNPAIQADDLIATIASKATEHHLPTVIVSTDHGFWQLLGESQLTIYNYFNKVLITPDSVLQRYQVNCRQLVDYWALTGSSSVNLKGVPGIGAKTAAQLIGQYGSLNALLQCAKGENTRVDKVLAHQDDAKLTAKLMQLLTDLPLGFNLKQLRYHSGK
ncbi:5'-3' exonuclease H3TH domain-containing protein [Celerinatantimonas yamalensis]|uniref:5'-3' exonuclease H3TH domain-containing protein n=1 Tax=Celerinatantimonas yamalensis TaxID=559956 RepID=A0ABW9G896_9GAMM